MVHVEVRGWYELGESGTKFDIIVEFIVDLENRFTS